MIQLCVYVSDFARPECLHLLVIFIAHQSSNDIHTDGAGARAKTGGYKGIRGDRRFKGRGGYPMETSYHFIHQNTFAGSAYVFHEALHEVATKM